MSTPALSVASATVVLMDLLQPADALLAAALLLAGAVLGWSLHRSRTVEAYGRLRGERDLLRLQVQQHEVARESDRGTAAELVPLRAALERVERHVQVLERDRVEQFGAVGERLGEVATQAAALGRQTSTLVGALNSSGLRGTWGEAQLRRVLEHAGMLARCDFDEQVSAVSAHDARVRPDVVVRLPGGRSLVVDAKVPLGAFLRAQADNLPGPERADLLAEHARALRGHVDALAAKAYWSAFRCAPELVVCFVPSDAVLAAALQAQPDLYDHAQARKVVLASPAVLLTVLRALALAWQQDALSRNAEELLRLGQELHQRLSTLGGHVGALGAALRRSVESYNALVGSLESRVLVTSRRMHELGVTTESVPPLEPVLATTRPLTTVELLDGELGAVADERGPSTTELSEPPRHRRRQTGA